MYPTWRVTGVKLLYIDVTAPTLQDAERWALAWVREQKLRLHSVEQVVAGADVEETA